MRSFTVETTETYIKHRLHVAGSDKVLFSPEAITAIHRYSGGLPRLINTLSDNSLFEAFMRRIDQASFKIVHSVAGDLGLLQQSLKGQSSSEKFPDLNEIENMLDRLEQKN
jgi:hypothetical protein